MTRRAMIAERYSGSAWPRSSAPAQAAVHDIKGRDSLDWDRPAISIAPGDTVRWTFDGTQQAHNVEPEGAKWMAASPLGTPAPSWEHTFQTEGVSAPSASAPTTMRGTIEVHTTPAAPRNPRHHRR